MARSRKEVHADKVRAGSVCGPGKVRGAYRRVVASNLTLMARRLKADPGMFEHRSFHPILRDLHEALCPVFGPKAEA